MADLAFSGLFSGDEKERKATFAQLLAEDTAPSDKYALDSIDKTRPNAAAEDFKNDDSADSDEIKEDLQLDSDQTNSTQSNMNLASLQNLNETAQLHAENIDLMVEYNRAMKQVEEQKLTHKSILSEMGVQKSRADKLQSMVNILQNENQQLKVSTAATATSFNDRIHQLHDEKDSLREKHDQLVDKIDNLQDERHRLKEDLRQKDRELHSMKTLELRIKDQVAEV